MRLDRKSQAFLQTRYAHFVWLVFLITLAITTNAYSFKTFLTDKDPNLRTNKHRDFRNKQTFSQKKLSGRNILKSTNTEIYNNMVDTLPKSSPSTNESFHSKSILITGASGGLGRSLALQFSTCIPRVLILSARNEEALKQVVEECKVISPTSVIHMLLCDLSNMDQVKQLGDEALKLCYQSGFGVVDVLVNNGGISSRSKFLDTTIEVDETVMRVNYLAGACLAKKVVPDMVKQKSGKIIWISSVQGLGKQSILLKIVCISIKVQTQTITILKLLVGIPNRTSYAASKFAVQGYCESLRAELAPCNVSVHVISPGYIRTNLSRSAMLGDGRQYNQMDATTASGADPQDVAYTILDEVAKGRSDIIVAATFSAKVAIWLRFLLPTLLQYLLVSRFIKSEQKSADKDKNE